LPAGELPHHSHDPAAARQLLEAAGWGGGLELVNLASDVEDDQAAYAAAFAEQYADLGVTILPDVWEAVAYGERARLAKVDPIAAGWHINMHHGNRYNDIGGYLAEYRTDSGRNYGHWGSPELDSVIEEQEQAFDPEQRLALAQQAQRTIAEEAYTPGLVLPAAMTAWNARLANMSDGPEPFQGVRLFVDSWFAS
jgi:peptide/nickel transport system substrate-binding protein